MESTTPEHGKPQMIVGDLHPHWVGDHTQCPNPGRCEAGGLWRDSWQDDTHFTPEALGETLRLAEAASAKIELDRAMESNDARPYATLREQREDHEARQNDAQDPDFPVGPVGAYQARMKAQRAAASAMSDLGRALDPRTGEKVCIGVPHLNEAGWNFVESVLRVAAYDKAHGNHLLHNSGLMNNGALAAVWGRSMELAHARNTAAAAFLASDSDWLLWWDSDIGAEQDALEKLLEVADPETAPIVGGLCFVEGEYTYDHRGGLRSSLAPTLYDWSWVEPKSGMPGAYKLASRAEWPPDAVTRVGATGTGFLLTHRSVYEKISAWLIEQGAPPHIWFERIPGPDGEMCGEDISFCLRAHQVGLPVLVHTGVSTTHQKTVWYGVPEYRSKPFPPPKANVLPLPPDQWPKLMINRKAAADAAENSPIREKQPGDKIENDPETPATV